MKSASLISVLLPLLVIAGWAGYHEYSVRSGTEVEFKVVGYDPRDLLSGHYLNYRVDYGVDVCGSNYRRDEDYCVCLVQTGLSTSPLLVDVAVSCESVSCPLYLRGRCTGRFHTGLEKFYFPDEYKDKLRVVPPNSSIRVKIDRMGRGHVVDFLVNGVPLSEYVRAN